MRFLQGPADNVSAMHENSANHALRKSGALLKLEVNACWWTKNFAFSEHFGRENLTVTVT
jgi:hypothetical protein